MKKLVLLLLLLSHGAWAQFNFDNAKEGVVGVPGGNIYVRSLGENGIEIEYLKAGEQSDASHARIQDYSEFGTKTFAGDSFAFSTIDFKLTVLFNPKTYQIEFYKNGELFLAQNPYEFQEQGVDGSFSISRDEVLYGGGERVLGMNRRGHKLYLYNRAHYGYETHSELMNFTMPIVMSSKIYAVHFDNPSVGHLDLDSEGDNKLGYVAEFGNFRYQVFTGDNWNELMDVYTDFSGKQPMIPRWALGNFSSRFGYHSQEEVLSTIDAFKKDSIPVDAIILDLYWFGKDVKGHMGNLEFLKDSFPEPRKMMQDLRSDHVKTILISEPFILTTSKRWEDADQNKVLGLDSIGASYTYDFFFGNTGLVDVFNPTAQRWFWDIYRQVTDLGVAGWWGDLGEPEVHPEAMLHYGGLKANQVHNIYGSQWAKLIYDGYQKYYPDERLFLLMRSGYSGAQRYGMIPWSGDVNRTWGGLVPQTEIALQMAMQGMAYMHSDLGGFAGANLDDELYVRWLQYGVFQPIYRPHAQEDVPSEPVFRSAKAKALAKEAIELRYRLLPYNYNLVFENHVEGRPLMRPLFFLEPDNKTYQNLSSTYLWGDSFLVSPVVESGKEKQQVHLPKDANWIDFYSGHRHEGGQVITVELREDHIPVYVREGAIVPMAKKMMSTEEYNQNDLVLHQYSHDENQAHGYVYMDDGKSPKTVEEQRFNILNVDFEQRKNEAVLDFTIFKGVEDEDLSIRIDYVLHGLKKAPKKIKMNKKELDFIYDASAQVLTIPGIKINSLNQQITIK